MLIPQEKEGHNSARDISSLVAQWPGSSAYGLYYVVGLFGEYRIAVHSYRYRLFIWHGIPSGDGGVSTSFSFLSVSRILHSWLQWLPPPPTNTADTNPSIISGCFKVHLSLNGVLCQLLLIHRSSFLKLYLFGCSSGSTTCTKECLNTIVINSAHRYRVSTLLYWEWVCYMRHQRL